MRHSFFLCGSFAVLMMLLVTSGIFASTDSLNISYLKTTPIKVENLEDKSERNFLLKMSPNGDWYRLDANKYFSEMFITADTAKMQTTVICNFKDGSLYFSKPDMNKVSGGIYYCSTDLRTKDNLYLNNINLALDLKNKVLYYRWINPTGKNEPSISDKNTLLPGSQFPDIKFKSIEGKEVKLKDNRIKVINWWATTCLPCREEIPGLNKLVEKYKGKDIDFIAIVGDNEKLDQFLKTNTFAYEQCYSDKEAAKYFGNSFPRHVIVDGNNNIVYNVPGGWVDEYKELEKIIENLITK
ncbi:MAG: TlpA family protein disulfide reductase [Bacteroidota bacterium]